MNAYLLSLIIFTPLLGAVLITASLALPMQKAAREQLSRYIALGGSAIPFVLGIYLWVAYKGSGGPGMGSLWSPPQYVERFVWIPSLNIEYFVGVDGISVSMVILSTLISMIACIASMPWWKRADEHEDPHHPHFSTVKVPGYMAMLLLLETGMSGTFASMDMFLFFVFWEVMLLPMYFLIGIWGGPRKEYAAIKFFLYTLAGSVLLLLAIIALYYRSGDQNLLAQLASSNRVAFNDLVAGPNRVLVQAQDGSWGYLLSDGTISARTFNMIALARLGHAGLFDLVGPFLGGVTFVKLMWVFMFIAFAVKVPMVPFHTWLPDAHVEAPTPISVILAGVLLKMGIYGMLRFNWAMLPAATKSFAGVVALFGVINVVYAAMVCLAQKDFKKLIAYSSVSHMGFSLLGMVAFTEPAISGAVLNLFTHGIISPMLFLIVGVIYDRAHHREIDGFGGLARVVPEYTALMGLAFFASLGLPGLAGFISEFLVLNGSFMAFPWHTALVATSVIITAAYYLWTIQRIFLGKLNEKYAHLPDLNWRERLTLYPLGALAILFGFYPNVLLKLINTDIHALMNVVKGA
jgi:NADH-quinone oxidoreductase subunit M